MFHSAVALSLGVAVLARSSLPAAASGATTCQAASFSAGHDFKNGQYAHINGTSAADWCASLPAGCLGRPSL